LAASLDHRSSLTAMAQVAVPGLGDWCVIDLLEDDGTVIRLPVAHVDPSGAEAAAELAHLAPDPGALVAALEALPDPAICDAAGAPLVTMLGERARAGLLRPLRLRACLSVPLVARGRKLGLITSRCRGQADNIIAPTSRSREISPIARPWRSTARGST